jgi:hypothetical protein
MPRLDKFIQAMRDHRAESLHLSTGKPAALMVSGAARPITRDVLASPQILALLREIAPPALGAELEQGGQSFTYEVAGGSIQIELTASPDGLAAVLRPRGATNGNGTPAADGATTPPPRSAPARTTLRSAVMTEDPGAQRNRAVASDSLRFRRVGSAPPYR